jgi:hypothetical protein
LLSRLSTDDQKVMLRMEILFFPFVFVNISVSAAPTLSCPSELETKVRNLNPPSPPRTGRLISDYAAECEAVLGPIPAEVDCGKASRLPHYAKEEATHLAGPERNPEEVRLSVTQRGTVTWVLLCNSFTGTPLKDPNVGGPQDTSLIHIKGKYGPVGYIGTNTITGESCFFKAGEAFDGKPKDGPSHGGGVSWASPRFMMEFPGQRPDRCFECHIKGGPFLVSDVMNQERLGGDGSNGIIPLNLGGKLVGGKTGPYRVIGTEFNALWRKSRNGVEPLTVQPILDSGEADRTCTRCHIIPNSEKYYDLAEKAAGVSGWLEHTKFMPPGPADRSKKAKDDLIIALRNLRYCIDNPQDKKHCQPGKKIISDCPSPGELDPKEVSVAPRNGSESATLRWNYTDAYNERSGVKQRDDIRISVSLRGPSGESCVFNDLSPTTKFGKTWQFKLPAETPPGYRLEIRSVRHCFDGEGTTESESVIVQLSGEGLTTVSSDKSQNRDPQMTNKPIDHR